VRDRFKVESTSTTSRIELCTRCQSADDLTYRYHQQAINQSTILFYLSVLASVGGFSLIAYAAIVSVGADSLQLTLRAIPGSIFECLAILFFKQSARLRRRATDLYDRLRSDQKHMSVLALIESIDNPQLRNLIKAQVTSEGFVVKKYFEAL